MSKNKNDTDFYERKGADNPLRFLFSFDILSGDYIGTGVKDIVN